MRVLVYVLKARQRLAFFLCGALAKFAPLLLLLLRDVM